MRTLKFIDQKAGRVVASLALLLATVLPTMAPSLAAAATITTRSIEMSSSVMEATGVSYNVEFTTASSASATGSFVIDFCTTPTIGTACSLPSGFSIGTIGTTSAHAVTEPSANRVQVVLDSVVGASATVEADITGVVNPDTTDTFYARIVTYATDTPAYTDPETLGAHVDEGTVALTATQGIGVSGAVLESLIFCVSGGANITTGCTGTHTAPNVSLGVAGVLGTELSAGSVYSQLSTNAVGGAVVSLKSDSVGCGGLSRAGAASPAVGCGITPQTTAGVIGDNTAKFGVQLWGVSGVTAIGDYPVQAALDLEENFYMDYPGNDTTGVTSAYGSPIFSSATVVNDGTANLGFGANVSNTTAAGTYSAALSLVATGKF